MIVCIDPPAGAPATLATDARAVALAHPGEHKLKLRAGGHELVYGERVDVTRDLVAALEDLGFTVGVEA